MPVLVGGIAAAGAASRPSCAMHTAGAPHRHKRAARTQACRVLEPPQRGVCTRARQIVAAAPAQEPSAGADMQRTRATSKLAIVPAQEACAHDIRTEEVCAKQTQHLTEAGP